MSIFLLGATQTTPTWGYVETAGAVLSLENISDEGMYVGGWFNLPYNKFLIANQGDVSESSGSFPGSASNPIYDFQKCGDFVYAGSEEPGYYFTVRNSQNKTWDPLENFTVNGPVYGMMILPNGNMLVLGSFTEPFDKAFEFNVNTQTASEVEGIEFPWTTDGGLKSVNFKEKIYMIYFSDFTEAHIARWNPVTESMDTIEPSVPDNWGAVGIYTDGDYLYTGLYVDGDWQLWRFSGTEWEFLYSFGWNFIAGISPSPYGIYVFGEFGVFEFNTSTNNISEMDKPETGIVYDVAIGDDGTLYLGTYGLYYYGIIEADTTTSIWSENISSVNVYPNPATNIVTIEIENTNYENILIHNSVGQRIEPNIVSKLNNSIVLNIKSLPPGMYSILIENADGNLLARFVK